MATDSLAVGQYCTRGGNQGSVNLNSGKAPFCTTDFGKSAELSFCTMLCRVNAECGERAICTNGGGDGPNGCVPANCAS